MEPAPQIAAAARAAGLTVHDGLLEDQQYAAGSFGAAALFEVVEHLKDPRALIVECRRILKPRGILVISTGNAASWTASAMGAHWDYFDMAKDGGHVSFFNPESIRQLAGHCGFALERLETSRVKFLEKEGAPRWLYSASKLAGEALNFPARLLGKGHDLVAYLRAV